MSVNFYGQKKMHRVFKLAAFLASVFSLSCFFAGWRQVHEAQGISAWLLLGSGTLATVALLAVQSYWIYFDEKAKGRLRKQIKIFDALHDLLAARALVSSGGKGDINGKR